MHNFNIIVVPTVCRRKYLFGGQLRIFPGQQMMGYSLTRDGEQQGTDLLLVGNDEQRLFSLHVQSVGEKGAAKVTPRYLF